METVLYQRKRIVFAYILYKFFLKKTDRRYWIHPFTELRLARGRFATSFSDLRENPGKFYNYFRMSIQSFDELAARISDKIKSQDTWMRLAIPPIEMLAITLRYLGSGCNQLDLHLTYRIGHTTIGRILRKVCKVIWDTIREESFPPFTEERWKAIAERFQERCQFPNCLGAIDGKHVRIRKPKLSGSLFHNYKNYFSVVLLAVADADYKFVYIDVGAFGKDSDSTIFQKSDFYRKLESNELKIPKGQPLPGTDAPSMPYTFVADEAFSLSQNVIRPYSGKVLSEKKRVFNYRLSRARRNVESTFGILSNKWGIFHKAINVDLNFAITLIKTCCALHNFVRTRDGIEIQDIMSVQGIIDVNQGTTRPLRPPIQFTQSRNMLADYFVSEAGSVPWQTKYI